MSFERVKILDHGYLEFVEHWGSDKRIVEAARMSTGKGFLGWGPVHVPECPKNSLSPNMACSCSGGPKSGDEKLLKYLYEHHHATPFEMAGMVIEVQAPIMVFREWHRHHTQSYNEMSARYTPLPDVNYIPTADRCMVVSATNKQAGSATGAVPLTHENVLAWLTELFEVYEHAECVYQSGLIKGIPKELARLPVPVGRYSKMRASANLRNWLAFLTLRMDANAQWEIRMFANAVGDIIANVFPRTWELFLAGRS